MGASSYNPRQLTLLDRALSYIAPGRALDRVIDRTKLHHFAGVYEAAHPGSRRGGSGGQAANGVSESWQANRDRFQIMWAARKAERNIPFIAGVLDREASYTCNKIEYHANLGEPQINTLYEDYFHDWCARADITGRHRLSTLVELGYRAMRRDGDCGFNLLDQGGELRLQLIEADRIGSPQESIQAENYFSGVTVNALGQVTSVRVFQRTRTGQYVNPQEIPPSRFVHLFRPTRVDQYRGVSPLACILPKAQDLHEWMAIAMQNGKTAAIWSAFVKVSDPNKTSGGVSWDDKDDQGTPTMAAQPGQIKRLAPGEEITFPTGTVQPSGQFMAFIQALVREMALGLNRPYGFIYNLAELGGVNSRIELMQAMRGIQRDQDLLVNLALERIKNEVLSRAIARRALPPHPNWRKGRWTFGAWLTGDVGYQTQADVELVKMGVKPISAWAAELDYDMAENARKNSATILELRDIAAQDGTLIEMLTPDWLPQATSQLAAANTPPSPPPSPPPGLIGEVGDKGVKPLVEIIEKVSTGTMDPDSGALALAQVYGWPLAKAKALLPAAPLPQPEPENPTQEPTPQE